MEEQKFDVSKLLNDNMVMREQVSELTKSLQQALIMLGSKPSPAPNKPPSFSGYRVKNSLNINDWIFLCEEYLKFTKANEEDAVIFAGSLLIGAAASWWASFRPTHPQLAWKDFVAALRKEFQDFNIQKRARDHLAELCQRNRSVQKYAQEFREIMRELPHMHEEDRIDHFTRKLKNAEIRKEIDLRSPATLDEAINIADRYDTILWKKERPSPKRCEHIPMEIDAITYTKSNKKEKKFSKLTFQEKKYLLDNKGCFYCRKLFAGHIAKNCPEKRFQSKEYGQ